MSRQLEQAFAATYGVDEPARRPRRTFQHKNPATVAAHYGISPSLLAWRSKKAEGRCRACLRPAKVRPLTEHHLVPESWFRGSYRAKGLRPLRNVAANLIPLCRPCHDLVEHEPAARSELRRLLAPDEVTFAIQTAGRDWLEHRYPLRRGR